jgi:type IV pilus assembly protein PilN
MIRFNLLGNRTALDYRGKYLLLVYLVIFGFSTMYMLSAYLGYSREIGVLEIRSKTLESDLTLIRKDTIAVKDLEKKREQLNKRLSVIAKLRRGRTGVVRLLDDFNMSLPSRVWLTEFTENGEVLSIKGYALGNQDIAQFMKRLERSDHFLTIDLVESRQVSISKVDGNVTEASALPGNLGGGPEIPIKTAEEQTLVTSGEGLDANQQIPIKEFVLRARISYQGKLRMSDYNIAAGGAR